MFIAVEGIDGVGKSTLVNAMSRRTRLDKIATPTQNFRRLALQAPTKGLFLLDMQLLSAELRHDTITDRWYYSTYAYQEFESLDEFWAEVNRFKIIKPDVSVYIGGTPHRATRLDKWENQDIQKKREKYAEFDWDIELSTDMTLEEQMEAIYEHVGL